MMLKMIAMMTSRGTYVMMLCYVGGSSKVLASTFGGR